MRGLADLPSPSPAGRPVFATDGRAYRRIHAHTVAPREIRPRTGWWARGAHVPPALYVHVTTDDLPVPSPMHHSGSR